MYISLSRLTCQEMDGVPMWWRIQLS